MNKPEPNENPSVTPEESGIPTAESVAVARRKSTGAMIAVMILLVACIACTFAAFSFTNIVRVEIASEMARRSAEEQSAGGAVATAIGLSFAIIILGAVALTFQVGGLATGLISGFLSLNRFRRLSGGNRNLFLVTMILAFTLASACIGAAIWLLVP